MDITRIILAEEQYLVRLGLKCLLNKGNMRIVGEATNEKRLMSLLQEKEADVLILDYNAPGAFDKSTITKVKTLHPEINFLIITGDHDKKSIFQVLQMGIRNFITKTCDKEEILDAISATNRKEKFFCARVLDYLLEKSLGTADSKGVKVAKVTLTPREIEIVRLVSKGKVAKEIAHLLNLSPHTVYTHRKKIMKKLNLSSTSELVLYAANQGIIERT